MTSDFDHIVYSKNVLEFITVANEYCVFVENAAENKKMQFLEKSQKILSLLYLKAAVLPKIESALNDGNEKMVTESDWIFIKNKISDILGTHDSFVEFTDTIVQQQEDANSLALSELYADIYQDLKDCIMLYRMGEIDIMNDAIWESKLNFEQYWGRRLLVVLENAHQLLYGEEDLEEEGEK